MKTMEEAILASVLSPCDDQGQSAPHVNDELREESLHGLVQDCNASPLVTIYVGIAFNAFVEELLHATGQGFDLMPEQSSCLHQYSKSIFAAGARVGIEMEKS